LVSIACKIFNSTILTLFDKKRNLEKVVELRRNRFQRAVSGGGRG